MSQPSIATRVVLAERDVARHELELLDHEKRLGNAETKLAVLAVKVGVGAAFGSLVGGGIVAGLVAYLTQ